MEGELACYYWFEPEETEQQETNKRPEPNRCTTADLGNPCQSSRKRSESNIGVE